MAVLCTKAICRAGVVVLLVLQFITPVFERVPYNAMGAIVLSSVLGLFELSEAIFLYKANFLDFLVWLAAFIGTVFFGVETGLVIAIGLALILVVYQSAFPHTAVLGRLPETRALPLPCRMLHAVPCSTLYDCRQLTVVTVDSVLPLMHPGMHSIALHVIGRSVSRLGSGAGRQAPMQRELECRGVPQHQAVPVGHPARTHLRHASRRTHLLCKR
jgi:MFS superfamily sulfate permease-like transporter